jgi:Ca2+-binding EF-hand superfamily protein
MINAFQSLVMAALLVAPCLFAAPATGQGLTAEEATRRFAVFDVNGDGRISKDEYELNKVLAIFDTRLERQRTQAAAGGHTGGIDHRQIAISREASGLKPEIFDVLDSNGNGTLSAGEIISSELMQFESIDRNGDGFIDRAEFNALIKLLFR